MVIAKFCSDFPKFLISKERFVNTATGTKHEKESSEDRALRRKGLCLVPSPNGNGDRTPFRISVSDNLLGPEQFQESLPPKPVEPRPETLVKNSKAGESTITGLLLAASVAGGIIGYLLGRKER